MAQDSNPQIPEAQQITRKRNRRIPHSRTAHHNVKAAWGLGERVGVGRGSRTVSSKEITNK